MKLAHPFYRLPLRFDVARLQAEAAQFAEAEWQRHPTGFPGNSALRLISVNAGDNDDFAGPMLPTPQLQRCPYMQQVLARFGVVWSRSRLMRLAPGASVPEHSDIDYHWFHRVRVHIPVVTAPAVSFSCGGQTVHMAAGEPWIFDNWRMHSVHNGSDHERIHLVADTAGSAAFWRMVKASQSEGFELPCTAPAPLPFDPSAAPGLLLEQHNLATVMPPAEVEQLTGDLLADLQQPASAELGRALDRLVALISGFSHDWRSLWSLYADSPAGWPQFSRLREAALTELKRIPPALVCASTRREAGEVFNRRVLTYAFRQPDAGELARTPTPPALVRTPASTPVRLVKPLFIVAAPRSGSTLLFETLAQAPGVYTLGGEAHALVEGLPRLRPQAEGIGSNRLTEAQVDAAVRSHVHEQLGTGLHDRDRRPPGGGPARFLEKTPKNSLRIPFFNSLFPDARFVFLWRDPRENISSIMEAWRSGGWRTYSSLPGWDGPWSMLLPPGYQSLRGRPPEEVAAFQWSRTNEIVLDDLSRLPRQRWMVLSHAGFLADPAGMTRNICGFAGLEFDARLASYLARPLPLSSHTLTPPVHDKWRANEAAVLRVMPSLEPLWARLQGLNAALGPD